MRKKAKKTDEEIRKDKDAISKAEHIAGFYALFVNALAWEANDFIQDIPISLKILSRLSPHEKKKWLKDMGIDEADFEQWVDTMKKIPTETKLEQTGDRHYRSIVGIEDIRIAAKQTEAQRMDIFSQWSMLGMNRPEVSEILPFFTTRSGEALLKTATDYERAEGDRKKIIPIDLYQTYGIS